MKKLFDKLCDLNLTIYLTAIHLLLFVGMGLVIVVYRFAPPSLYMYAPPALLVAFAIYFIVNRLRNRGKSNG